MKQILLVSSVLSQLLLITSCQPTNHPVSQTNRPAASQANGTLSQAAMSTKKAEQTLNAQQTSLTSQPASQATQPALIKIDWTSIDSGVKPRDKRLFHYPFELNSEPVKAYADMYHVDKETSRYNLTVGMAVNEVLAKVLDQIGTQYTYHELTAGKDSTFIIHTTEQIAPSEHIYVFAEPFAEGLTIPVKIVNDGKK